MPIPVSPAVANLTGSGVPGTLLHDGQVMLGGVTWGITDDFGVEWILESLKGWSDSPETNGSSEDRAGDHGVWLSPSYLGGRVVELDGSILASTWDGVSAALDRLMSSVPLSATDLMYVAEGSLVRQAQVRQEGRPLAERVGGWARVSLSLLAPDPRKYAADVTVKETGLPQTSGGLSLPITLPLTIGAATTSGVLSVVNAGNMATPPILIVEGPCPPFSITHLQTGKTLRFAESLTAGRSLVIDTDRRRALLDGTALRVVTGSWFDFAPGLNEVAFSAPTYNSSARLRSESRSAWR